MRVISSIGCFLAPCLLKTPAFLFEKHFPFQKTGLDIIGLFAAQTANANIKQYELILPCLTTRAVHLEMFVHISVCTSMRFADSLLDEEYLLHFFPITGQFLQLPKKSSPKPSTRQLFMRFLETPKFFGTSTQHMLLTSKAYGNASSEA